jgi:glycosyltransferase involved in cell wall biosynthesis
MGESRVCFVVTEIQGTTPSGGIGTVTAYAALVLSEAGYDVSVFHCGHRPEMEAGWAGRYAEAGVTLLWLDRSRPAHPPFLADSFRLYQQLKTHEFDAVVFQDWHGLGYCSMVAKQTGLAFGATRLIHAAHGPDDWLRYANRQLSVDGIQLTAAHMERRSAGLADAVVSPSRYLIEWMRRAGWDMPADQQVIPNFTEGATAALGGSAERRAVEPEEVLRELVFFGRLEERKGVRLFATALNLLGPELLQGIVVTFLGREASFTRDQVIGFISPKVRERLGAISVRDDFDQGRARAYLRQPGRLAVIPSFIDNSPSVVYECIEDGVPFLASSSGGTGELVLAEDRPATLFDPAPRSLADALAPLLERRRMPPSVRPAFSAAGSLSAWTPLLAAPEPLPVSAPSPLVSVVIVHFNQARLIRSTIESVAAQDYPDLEIVLVDDGSTDPDAVALLDQFEGHDWGRPFRLVRQENKYLGAARNTGMRHAQGEYIVYVDDDDFLDEAYVRAMVTAISTTGVDAVTVSIHAIEADERGDIVPGGEESVWCFLGDAPDLGTMENIFGGAAALYRKEVLKASGGFFEHRGIGHEDWDMLARIALAGGRIVSIPEPLYNYRVRPRSMLRSTPVYDNMQPVFASYRRHLPSTLRTWPELTRGQQTIINRLRDEVAMLRVECERLTMTLDHRERYLAVLRRADRPRRGRLE